MNFPRPLTYSIQAEESHIACHLNYLQVFDVSRMSKVVVMICTCLPLGHLWHILRKQELWFSLSVLLSFIFPQNFKNHEELYQCLWREIWEQVHESEMSWTGRNTPEVLSEWDDACFPGGTCAQGSGSFGMMARTQRGMAAPFRPSNFGCITHVRPHRKAAQHVKWLRWLGKYQIVQCAPVLCG